MVVSRVDRLGGRALSPERSYTRDAMVGRAGTTGAGACALEKATVVSHDVCVYGTAVYAGARSTRDFGQGGARGEVKQPGLDESSRKEGLVDGVVYV